MTTVRAAAFELFREHGMTTIFGNPGTTELPMLGSLPGDFRYVLGLHEMVAVGMADGYAQATGSVAHVNLHTAPGLGNGMGALFNARANKSPLLIQTPMHFEQGLPGRYLERRSGCFAPDGPPTSATLARRAAAKTRVRRSTRCWRGP